MLGVSYVVMQTAVENNYLPQSELSKLYAYIQEMDNDIEMIENADIIVGVDSSLNEGDDGYYIFTGGNFSSALGEGDARKKVQYGKSVTVGVTCDYVFIWPLDYRRDTEAEDRVEYQPISDEMIANGGKSNNNISIVYTVPGLKYYPDLLY